MKEKILVIEDNAEIRENTAEILELSGYIVVQAANGKIGVELAVKDKPRLILCDIMMPELDGYGVLHLLNRNPLTAHIPFIFLTAKAEKMDLRKGMEMGADDYLTKPFDGADLLNAVECRLSKEKIRETYYAKALKNLNKLAAGSANGLTELKKLIADRKIRQIRKKQKLYYEGDQPQGIYLLLEGVIKTFKLSPDGHELMTGWHQRDDYVGINALFLQETNNETAEAMEDSTICLLPKEKVLALADNYPEVSRRFMKVLAGNIREKEEQLIELAYLSVRKRLSQVLLRLCKKTASSSELLISRGDLATMAGMATETVSRTLSNFQTEGIIERKGSLIKILQLNQLAKMKN